MRSLRSAAQSHSDCRQGASHRLSIPKRNKLASAIGGGFSVTERYTRLKTLTQEIKQRMDAKDFAAVIALLQAEQQNAHETKEYAANPRGAP